MKCRIIAALVFLVALTGCNTGPSFKERCEAAGGTYELETEVQYWSEYDPVLKLPVVKPHYFYYNHCWIDGEDVDV